MLDMKEMKEEDIIKKALAGGLTDKEKEFLAGREPVLRHLKEQWNEPGDSFLSPVAKERVLGRVMRKIHPYNTRRDSAYFGWLLVDRTKRDKRENYLCGKCRPAVDGVVLSAGW